MASPTSDRGADPLTAALARGREENTPVNIAVPNWSCPHCARKYGPNLELASECAAAGPAPDISDGTPVLLVDSPHKAYGSNTGKVLFGLTEVGPVTAIRTDEGVTHQRDVLLAGTKLDSRRVASAPVGHGGLRILTNDIQPDPHISTAEPELSSYSSLAPILIGDGSFGTYRNSRVKVWIGRDYHRDKYGWWRTPNAAERLALNTATGGLLDKIVDADTDQLIERVLATYGPSTRYGHRSTQLPEDLTGAHTALALAAAHGGETRIWAMQWLTAHLSTIATWQVTTLQTWAAGLPETDEDDDNIDHVDTVSIPGLWLRSPDTLPKNPGKRRLAAMEPYGDGYSDVIRAVCAALDIPAPTNPVPGIDDVPTTVRAVHAALAARPTQTPTKEA